METADRGTLADIHDIALGLGAGDWDVALIGDGAGRGWDLPCGWSCVLIDRHGGEAAAGTDARKLFSGGMNFGTVDIAELMPYVQAMAWYDRHHGKARRAETGKDLLSVLIVTDRKSITQQALALQAGRERAAEICRKLPLWAAMMHFERRGYSFRWAWQERGRIALNSLADRMADVAKHAAANALAAGTAHIRTDLPESPSEEQLIYLFNAAAFPDGNDAKLIRRRRYAANRRSEGTGV
jgi:hypothetical protein